MSAKESALAKVQDLYVMQGELWNFLDADQIDIEKKQTAEKMLKAFKQLLKEVDWHYMGGEEVLQSMESIPQEVTQKLKKAPMRSSPAKVAARVEKAPVKKAKMPVRKSLKAKKK